MKKVYPFIVFAGVVFVAVVLMPAFLVMFNGNNTKIFKNSSSQNIPIEIVSKDQGVAVLRSKTNQVELLALEDYVVGVVAAEMPVTFEKEALKSQAIAARTYVVKAKLSQGRQDGADVVDTVSNQVYKSEDELQKLWGASYLPNINKIKEAVSETAGKILTFENFPITAAFFSTGNGRTEDAGDYWGSSLPYLTSVESPWDKESPSYETKQIFSVSEVENKLEVLLGAKEGVGNVTELTRGGRIAKIEIGGKTFTGREVREKLGLRSSDFKLNRIGAEIEVITKGFGHGIGMSQYGANGMARQGHTYKEILAHYYKGTKLLEASAFLPKLVAQK